MIISFGRMKTGMVLSEIRNFVDAAQESVEPDQALATVLFTDIVGIQTSGLRSPGGGCGGSVLDAHFSMARSQICSIPASRGENAWRWEILADA